MLCCTAYVMNGFVGRPMTERTIRARAGAGAVTMRLFDHKRRAEALTEELFGVRKSHAFLTIPFGDTYRFRGILLSKRQNTRLNRL